MKVLFLENEAGINRSVIMDSLKQAIQERKPGFQNDAVFSLAYEREDQFFLKSPEAILWGKVYFEPPQENDLEVLKSELKKLSGIFRRKIIPYVFLADETSAWLGEFGQVAEDSFVYGFVQSEGRRALMLRKVLSGQKAKQASSSEVKSKIDIQGKEKPARPFQLSREELSELIDLSLELRCLN